MASFRILDLPSVAAHEVLKMAIPYDLFSFSMHSKQAQNIVKTFANRYKYHLSVDVNKSRIDFNYEKAEKNGLVFEVLLDNQSSPHVLHFDGCPTRIFTDTNFDENNEKKATVVKTYWNGDYSYSGFKCLIEYMSKVFKNMKISVNFGHAYKREVHENYLRHENLRKKMNEMEKEHMKMTKGIKEAIKTIKPIFICFEDMNSSYTFKPISELMVNCKRLTIGNGKLNNQECKKLVDKWMEGGSLEYAKFGVLDNCINLELVAPAFSNNIVSKFDGMTQNCEIERADGVKAKLSRDFISFTLEVI